MLQKMTLEQLQNSGLDQLKVCYAEATKRKEELDALKQKGGKSWNSALQEELDDVALYIVDIEDMMYEKQNETADDNEHYWVESGTEKLVHLAIVKGRRFNPTTGKEESKPYIQLFTFAEWQLFKKNFRGLGYSIMKVLHDPYGEAKDYVTKED